MRDGNGPACRGEHPVGDRLVCRVFSPYTLEEADPGPFPVVEIVDGACDLLLPAAYLGSVLPGLAQGRAQDRKSVV